MPRMGEQARLLLQQQLQAQREQYAAHLESELLELAALASRLQQPGALESRRQQVQNLRDRLHRMAGAAGTFGFTQVGNRARALEQRIDRWLDSQKPSGQALAALASSIGQFAGEAFVIDSELALPLHPETDEELSSGCRIYLLDSLALAAQATAQALRNFGYEVLLCQDRPALRQAIARQAPDALVVSVRDDADLAEVAALQQGLEAPIPLLVIHERFDFASQLAAVRAGAQGYFARPLNITQLETGLERCLNRPQHEPYRVMIVDDDAVLAEHYSLVLQNSQMQVRLTSAPEQVLDMMQAFNPEVLLLDVNMPGCSGPELAQMIRLHDEWLRVPIIYLSAETDIARQMAALLKAGDDFITKPISDSQLIASVFSHAQRARALSNALARDSLTGLLKHADIKEQLALEAYRASRANKPTSVVMLDLDHFKAINDTHGHAAGDSVIRALANLLRQRLRRIDSLGRYGGEEFVVVLPECPAAEAARIFDEIRERFAELTFNGSGDRPFRVTFSAGICETEGDAAASALLERADQALYRAKHDGRNRVRIAAAQASASR